MKTKLLIINNKTKKTIMKTTILSIAFLLISVLTFTASAQSEMPSFDSSIEVRLSNGMNTFAIPNSKSSLRVIVRNGDIIQAVVQTEGGKSIKADLNETAGVEVRNDCGECGKNKYIAFTWNDDSGNGGFGCKACKGKKAPNSSSNSEPLTIYLKNAPKN